MHLKITSLYYTKQNSNQICIRRKITRKSDTAFVLLNIIINGEVSLWALIKRENNGMFSSENKQQSVRKHDQSVYIKVSKDVYGRLIIPAKSNRDIDQKYALGNFEFTLTPRSFM